MPLETDQIAARYARRTSGDLYSLLRPEVVRSLQEKERGILRLFADFANKPLRDLRLLEIGCGNGSNLTSLIRCGLHPANLVANELLPDRAADARVHLPAAVAVHEGDATALPFAPGSFDVVYASVVFSSILDDGFQTELARKMWQLTAPGGAVLWYDFVYDNPSNKDVRGVPVRRIRALFPDAHATVRRVTLAPPISRRVCRVWAGAYGLFNALPVLRSHVLCWLAKPR